MKQTTALRIMNEGHNVFLTGSAGAGKSYTLRQFIKHARDKGLNVAVTASSGVAATILGGSTVHSFASIGIKNGITATDIYNIRRKKPVKDRLEQVDVLIIDEISMLHARQLNMVNYVLKSIRNDFRPFGGVQVIVAGDYLQLPPVGPEAPKDRFAFMSRTWLEAEFKICYLTEQHRNAGNYLNVILNAIRDDVVLPEHEEALKSTMHTNLGEDATKLYTHNMDVDALNTHKLNNIAGESVLYQARTDGDARAIKFLSENALSPPNLVLKVGAKVMFTKNDTDGAYVNGTMGTIIKFAGGLPIVKTTDGTQIVADWNTWEKQDDFGTVSATYSQIPLRLAWAITVHKSQGISIDEAEINLSKCFEMGQGYVALSRLRDIKGLRLLGLNNNALKLDPLAKKADVRFRELSDELVQEYGDE